MKILIVNYHFHYVSCRRSVPLYERNYIIDQLLAILNCQYEKVALETIGLKRNYSKKFMTYNFLHCIYFKLLSMYS